MTSQQYRRPRGTPTVAMHIFVAPEVKNLIDLYVARSNAPIWAIVEAAVKAGVPDETGIPVGWELPTTGQPLPDIEDGGPAQKSA